MRAALVACLLAVAASLAGLNLLAAGAGGAPQPSLEAADRSADRETVAFQRARHAARSDGRAVQVMVDAHGVPRVVLRRS